MIRVPLTNAPNQRFQCTLPVNDENIQFVFELWYNEQAEYWILSLTNKTNQEQVFVNLPLLTTKNAVFGNLMCQLEYKNVGICYIFPTSEDLKSMPNDKELGELYLMVWGDNNEQQ